VKIQVVDDCAHDPLSAFLSESALPSTDEIRPRVAPIERQLSPSASVDTKATHDAHPKAGLSRERPKRTRIRSRYVWSVALSVVSFCLGVVTTMWWFRVGELPSWPVPVTMLPAYLGQFAFSSNALASHARLPSVAVSPPMSFPISAPAERGSVVRARLVAASPLALASERVASTPSTDSARMGHRTSSPSPLSLADAQLCRNLPTNETLGVTGGWHCDRVSLPVGAGPLVFYTRVRSASDTSVQHRWYRGAQLRKSVDLQIRANPSDGYRTYSRFRVDQQSLGDWRVELRTSGGFLLHEERFIVR
jgi:hypothetical protein